MGKVGDKLLNKLKAAVEDGVTLRVVTVVGDVTADVQDKAGAGSKVEVDGTGQPCISTVFDLIDGDVRTYVHHSFVKEEPLKPMLTFHKEREQLAQDRVEKNIQALKSLYCFVRDELDKRDGDATGDGQGQT